MPLDKFGRHLHGHPTAHPQVFLFENVSKMFYERDLRLAAVGVTAIGSTPWYVLSHGLVTYTVTTQPATITHVHINPDVTPILLNDSSYKAADMVGMTLKPGDKLNFKVFVPNTVLFVEFLLKAPIITESSPPSSP